MKRVFGLETEYGITIAGSDGFDVVAESIELVRSYTESGDQRSLKSQTDEGRF